MDVAELARSVVPDRPSERLFANERDFQGIEVINLTGFRLTDYQKIREIRDWLKGASGKVARRRINTPQALKYHRWEDQVL